MRDIKGKKNPFFGRKHTEETKRKAVKTRMRNGSYVAWNKGIPMRKSSKLKLRKGHLEKGIKPPSRKGISMNIGERNGQWKGGIWKKTATERRIVMSTKEYKLWRKSVFERDNYICVRCFKRGGELHADHIKPFSLYPELRFAIDNGRTLCVECHRKTDTWGSHKRATCPTGAS